jgi:epoxyqueuosine reductase
MVRGSVSFSDHDVEGRDRERILTAHVHAEARRLGFDAVGIARADLSLDRDIEHYETFIRDGMHGEMSFLARNVRVRARLDTAGMLPGAKSVVCVARRYQRPAADESNDAAIARGIARYARGRDYHGFLRRRIRRLARFLRSMGTVEQPVKARPLCDDEPVLERAWAARAGLGFVGKNGMLIVPGLGSMVILGEVVTTLALVPGTPMAERCGTCTRCLDVCPTNAFAAPFVLDARKCISYLTIEHRSPIPVTLRESVGDHLFGCDECQTVCPFNAAAGARAPLPGDDGDPFVPLERWSRVRLEDLLALDAASWPRISGGTPLKRAGRIGIARNAAIVLGNRGEGAALPALRRAARDHDAAVVREAADWAIDRIAQVNSARQSALPHRSAEAPRRSD